MRQLFGLVLRHPRGVTTQGSGERFSLSLMRSYPTFYRSNTADISRPAGSVVPPIWPRCTTVLSDDCFVDSPIPAAAAGRCEDLNIAVSSGFHRHMALYMCAV